MLTLAAARRNRQLTQQQLAERLGVERGVISAWEQGTQNPSASDLQRLCDALEIAPAELELRPTPPEDAAAEAKRRQLQEYNESMGYVDYTVLRGGRYDVDPAFHEKPDTQD